MPIPNSENVYYNLSISHTQLRVIAAALNELPYRLSAPILEALEAQVAAIDVERAKAVAEAKGEKSN